MISVILFIHIILCIALVVLILLQQGKGASMGAAFGSGASGTVFGSRGPAGFMMKLTASIVTLFFVTSISLGYLAATQAKSQQGLAAPITVPVNAATTQPTVPAATKSQQSIPAAPK